MATALSKIKRSIRDGEFRVGAHFLEELAADSITLGDAISSMLNAEEFDKLTDDESHIRYRIFGRT